MSTKDGGPAFPAVIPIEHSDMQGKDYPNFSESGMTLRDWFAGQMLNGIASTIDRMTNGLPNIIARDCYVVADAMIEERKK